MNGRTVSMVFDLEDGNVVYESENRKYGFLLRGRKCGL